MDSPERPRRTKKFQQINDAYYTLSDPGRRKDYDSTRQHSGFGSSHASANQDAHAGTSAESGGAGFSFPWSAFGFGGGKDTEEERKDRFANEQFGSAFEEMLREEGMADDEGGHARPTGKFWSMVGGLSGGAMGFIVANFPGAVAGAVAGNRLGAVRDKHSKSVYEVFKELPQADKARMLSELAQKVFATALSG